MGEKFEKFKDSIADKTAKVVAFTRRHPVLTIIASNIVVAAVSGGVAYAKTKGGMLVDGEEADQNRYNNHENHELIAREGSLYSNEIDKSIETHVRSERINNIVKGVEQMDLRVGDAVYTVKTDEDGYYSVLIANPDESKYILDQFRNDAT